MRHSVGGSWVCLALLALVACSSPAPPPPEGLVTITNGDTCGLNGQIAGPGGLPTGQSLSADETVLDGRGGFHVSCSVKPSGSGFSVAAEISDADITVTVSNGTVAGSSPPSGTATLYLTTTQSLNTYTGTGCTFTATATDGVFKVEPGSLWAQYNCDSVQDPQNASKTCSPRGVIIVTGCDR